MSAEVKAWKCDYCDKTALRRGTMTGHEAACKYNPARKHCQTCIHSGWKVMEHHEAQPKSEWFGEMPAWDSKELYCLKLDKPMHEKPWLIECDVNYGYDGSESPVPFTCEHYENKKEVL